MFRANAVQLQTIKGIDLIVCDEVRSSCIVVLGGREIGKPSRHTSCRNLRVSSLILQGHKLKGGDSKINAALSQMSAKKRLILSGTPVQVPSILFHFC